MRKDRSTYEFVEPELFGREWQFLINGNLGRSLVVDKFTQFGLTPVDRAIDNVLNAIKVSDNPAQYNDEASFLSLYDLVSSED